MKGGILIREIREIRNELEILYPIVMTKKGVKKSQTKKKKSQKINTKGKKQGK
jgi:hypothetical protein